MDIGILFHILMGFIRGKTIFNVFGKFLNFAFEMVVVLRTLTVDKLKIVLG